MKKNILGKNYNFLRPIKNDNLIRLGDNIDGGYIVDSEIIKKIDTLITFGLGDGSNTENLQWAFERDLLKLNNNIKIFVYDHTVGLMNYFRVIFKYLRRFLTFRCKFIDLKKRLNFLKEYLLFVNSSNVNLYQEKICANITSKKEANIKKVLERLKHENKNIVLKCDIEGSEYEIINDIIFHESKFDMLIFEFHWIDKKKNEFINSVKKILNNFFIIHIHANNHNDTLEDGLPIVLEMTFINKKKFELKENNDFVKSFPIKGLDFPCNPYKDDTEFNFN